MASLECRSGHFRVVFRYKGQKHHFTVGDVDATEADIAKTAAEELLRLLQRNLVSIPAGCSVEEFLFHRGKPPTPAVAAERKELTLATLRDVYLAAQKKKLEQTTLDGITLHFHHLTRILKNEASVSLMTRADMQRYADKRSAEWIDPNVYRRRRLAKQALLPLKRRHRSNRKPIELLAKPRRHPSSATIRKEIVSLRTAWNWARRHLGLAEEFPGTGLDFAKTEESLPFMTWDEAERRIAAGDDAEKVWECIYLRAGEIAELLTFVSTQPVRAWVYPMLCFAAHTGARRSEIVRALPSDVDLSASVVTIREKKRDKRKLTTRRVPLTTFLRSVLRDWMKARTNGKTLFCKSDGKEITPREAMNYFARTVRASKWKVLKGLHTFRHSFISALASKGVDQRIIDDIVGHQTDEQRRRYRHLYPDVKLKAIAEVFG
jgi:integrase